MARNVVVVISAFAGMMLMFHRAYLGTQDQLTLGPLFSMYACFTFGLGTWLKWDRAIIVGLVWLRDVTDVIISVVWFLGAMLLWIALVFFYFLGRGVAAGLEALFGPVVNRACDLIGAPDTWPPRGSR